MFRIILALLLLLPANVFAYECSREIDELAKEYSIDIHCKLSSISNNFLNITGKEAGIIKINVFSQAFRIFLSSYNKKIIETKIVELILLEDLKYKNYDVGGLSNGKIIFISIENYEDYAMEIYLRALHHEFSSNIYKDISLEKRNFWNLISMGDYDTSEKYMIYCLEHAAFAKSSNDYINSKGFIYHYGRTSGENDFNSFAETLFENPEKIKKLKNKFSLIDKKLKITKQFYRDSGFVGKFPDET